jgi:uncharacterized protein (TIGR00369 family)
MDNRHEGVRMDVGELKRLLAETFPQSKGIGEIEAVGSRSARLRHRFTESDLRPGETLSGPVMMALADLAFYVALLASIGPKILAVTTSFNINFLRKPSKADVIAEAQILRLGRQLAVGEVRLFSEGLSRPVATAMVTYAIPA